MSGDGVIDLVCQFDRTAMKLDSARPEIVLAGRTTHGRRVGGYLTLPKRF